VIRKAARILRDDGAAALGHRARRYALRAVPMARPIELTVAIDDVLAADWTSPPAVTESTAPLPQRMTVNWLIPAIAKGAGGHHNILRFVRHLESAGHRCRIFLYDPPGIQTADEARTIIRRHFPAMRATVHRATAGVGDCDVLVATSWQTAYPVFNAPTAARKIYFVQDFEPFFYPMGTQHVLAENTYRMGLRGITLGRWLSTKLSAEYGMRCDHYAFGTENDQYAFRDVARQKKVIFYARPVTPRRGFELGVLALALFAREHPDHEIHMIGSSLDEHHLPFAHVRHGVLSPTQLAALYNEAAAALVISFTNMSLLPLELLSAGCIPVVNDADNNTMVSDNDHVVYAQPSPQALARALHETVSRPDLREHARRAAASVGTRSWDDECRRFETLLRAS
jgi:glycosyltransferase involved in cell wall biosynthesis